MNKDVNILILCSTKCNRHPFEIDQVIIGNELKGQRPLLTGEYIAKPSRFGGKQLLSAR